MTVIDASTTITPLTDEISTITSAELAEINADYEQACANLVLLRRELDEHWDLLAAVDEYGSKRDMRRWFSRMDELSKPYGYWTFRAERLSATLAFYKSADNAQSAAA